jgi:hypothetical protein
MGGRVEGWQLPTLLWLRLTDDDDDYDDNLR